MISRYAPVSMYSLSFFLPVFTWLMPWFGAVVVVLLAGTFALVGGAGEEGAAGLA